MSNTMKQEPFKSYLRVRGCQQSLNARSHALFLLRDFITGEASEQNVKKAIKVLSKGSGDQDYLYGVWKNK